MLCGSALRTLRESEQDIDPARVSFIVVQQCCQLPSVLIGIRHFIRSAKIIADPSHYHLVRGHEALLRPPSLTNRQPYNCPNRIVHSRAFEPERGWEIAIEGVVDA
jgi:hypothetical protein